MNLRDYIAWRGDLSFDVVPFNQIDAALFSQLSMLELDEILIKNGRNVKMTIEEIVECLDNHIIEKNYNLGFIMPNDIIEAFIEMSKTKRYKDLVIGNYVNRISKDEETQFSALTIDLDYNTRIVSFSGTDDTLIGWKENFNMLYLDTTSGQHLSCAYLEKVSKKHRHLYIIGHSKGANLAMYSALHTTPRVQKKIEQVIGFDGPGLTEDIELIDSFDKNIQKITFYVPDSSIIGVLFDHYETVKIVKSNAKGLYQHDLFSWEVRALDFVYAERTKESFHIEKKIKEMISKMDEHTKHVFVNEGYKLLVNSKNETLTEVNKDKLLVAKSFLKLDPKVRVFFTKIFIELAKDKIIRETIVDNVIQLTKNRNTKKDNKNS